MDKKQIFERLRELDAATVYSYIVGGTVTFEELRTTGRFDYTKQQEVKALLKEVEEKQKVERAAWARVTANPTLSEYRSYLKLYPEGIFRADAKAAVVSIEEVQRSQQEAYYTRLREDRMNYDSEKICRLLQEGKVTEQGLVSDQVYPSYVVDMLKSPPDNLREAYRTGWEDLPPLESDRTDIYFFGIPSSGKSCLLGGILSYAETQRLELHIANPLGMKYANTLKNLVKMGFVPKSTRAVGACYVSASIGPAERKRPLNIVEMSGEFFKNTYDTINTSDQDSIGANGYLKNENRKLIFLVVDYYHATTATAYERAEMNQSDRLQAVLQLLKEDGTLSLTDGVYIVVTKCDQLDGGPENEAAVSAFVSEHYNGLRQSLREMSGDYGFKTSIFPFSLGYFYTSDTFEYEKEAGKKIFDEILSATFFEKKETGKGFRGFLGI